MSEREDTLKPAMEMGPMQGTQMQTNAFNPMQTKYLKQKFLG